MGIWRWCKSWKVASLSETIGSHLGTASPSDSVKQIPVAGRSVSFAHPATTLSILTHHSLLNPSCAIGSQAGGATSSGIADSTMKPARKQVVFIFQHCLLNPSCAIGAQVDGATRSGITDSTVKPTRKTSTAFLSTLFAQSFMHNWIPS